MRVRGWLAAPLAAVLVAAGACGESEAGSTATVLAASSLTESFTALEAEFERLNPGTQVEIGYGSSSSLAVQLTNGSTADVFASADNQNMEKAAKAGVVSEARPFASNSLTIVVPAGNPGGITGLADLVKPGLTIAMAAPAVPVGRVAREVFGKAGLGAPVASEEPDVKSVVNRVVLGEADAGLVWTSDVRAAGDKVAGVAVPADLGGTTSYPIAKANTGSASAAGASFIEFVLSEAGQRILREHGFGPVA